MTFARWLDLQNRDVCQWLGQPLGLGELKRTGERTKNRRMRTMKTTRRGFCAAIASFLAIPFIPWNTSPQGRVFERFPNVGGGHMETCQMLDLRLGDCCRWHEGSGLNQSGWHTVTRAPYRNQDGIWEVRVATVCPGIKETILG